MKKLVLIVSVVLTGSVFAQDCSKLFISEYVEGLGNNKAIEIYNPTASTIDLSQYFIARFSNGSNTTSAGASVQLRGTIAPFGVQVAVLDKRNPAGVGQEAPVWTELQAKADEFYSPVYNTSNAFYWNGNDAIMLAKGSAASPNATNVELIDVFGKIGQDPVNSVAGTNGWSSIAPFNMTSNNPMDRVVTENHSMIRKASVRIGKNSPVEVFGPSYVFNPLLQYDSIPPLVIRFDPITGDTLFQNDGVTPQTTGNWESLGFHNCDCNPLSIAGKTQELLSLYPNPSTGAFNVKGMKGMEVISIFNTLGQKVISIPVSGNTTASFNLELKGVYFVRFMSTNGESITKKVIVK